MQTNEWIVLKLDRCPIGDLANNKVRKYRDSVGEEKKDTTSMSKAGVVGFGNNLPRT